MQKLIDSNINKDNKDTIHIEHIFGKINNSLAISGNKNNIDFINNVNANNLTLNIKTINNKTNKLITNKNTSGISLFKTGTTTHIPTVIINQKEKEDGIKINKQNEQKVLSNNYIAEEDNKIIISQNTIVYTPIRDESSENLTIHRNIKSRNTLFLHNFCQKSSYDKSIWLTQPLNKDIWFKGKIKATLNKRNNIVDYKFFDDNCEILLISAIKKGQKYSFFIENEPLLKIGLMTNNIIYNIFNITQDINNFLTTVSYEINIFGLKGPMKLKVLLKNEKNYEFLNKTPEYNSSKIFFYNK